MRIKLNLKYLLGRENKTKYWLVKQLNSNYVTVNKLMNNETTKISFDMMERLIKVFGCDMNTLFVVEDEDKE